MAERQADPDEDTVRLERELFEKRRRSRRRRRVRPWLALVVVLALVAGGLYAVWWSSLLSVEKVEVTGTTVLPPVLVREAARVPTGDPLARVDLAAVRERVLSLPAVRSARVSRSWPHAVRIDVTERVAVAVVPRGNAFRGLAADGVLFRTFDRRPPGLPVVQDDEGADKRALSEAARVVGSLPPDLLRRVEHISVKTIDEITLVLRSGRLVVWGNAANSTSKAEVFAALVSRPSRLIDVSVPSRPVTRP